MLTIKKIVVENMKKITLVMVILILFFSTVIQIFSARQKAGREAEQLFIQIGQILEENSKELEQVRAEYDATCLNRARTVAYILEYNRDARDDLEELKKIAAGAEVDEIHIFNTAGEIVSGTHPIYYGYSFDSGEQMHFFKPLLDDKSLELVQDVTPNTAEGKLVQYSALWSEDGEFIVEIGMYPETLLRATEKNELSYIFSLLSTGANYNLFAIDAATEKVVGSTKTEDVGKDMAECGFAADQLEIDKIFYARPGGGLSQCFARQIGENYIVWERPMSDVVRLILSNELLLLAGLILIALILVYGVADNMDRTVIDQIKQVNDDLRLIQNGDLTTKVDVKSSREFVELSAHVNSMVDSLLQSSEKLELSEKIKSQNEELEIQHEQLETALDRAETACKAKSEFLFNMSHDIRTPMNAILGFTSLALETEDPEVQKEYLQNIDASSKQLLDIINNILELSKIENQKITVEEDLVNVEEMFRKLYTMFDSDLKQKNQIRTVRMDIRHPYMYVDTAHYARIFLNIVSNAIKYTPDGGKILFSFRELPEGGCGDCVLETVVEDSGIGMSDEFLANAYEAFSRERTSTESGIQGTGLGLAIVKNLVELMKGTVSIKSRQGEGTTVTIRIPHRLGEASGITEAETAEKPDFGLLQGKRILLAEDIDVNAIIATKLLTGKGCLVDRVRDGVECVDMLLKAEADYYDMVFMDIQMPNMDGYQATRTIRAFTDRKKAAIPILAMTANAFKEDCEKALEVGMDGHIAKPVNAAKLFEAMAEVFKDRVTV